MSCSDCDPVLSMNEKLQARAIEAEAAKQAQVEIANGLQHKVNGLKAALTAQFKEGEHGEEIQRIYELWKVECGKTDRCELGPKRANAVKARLNGKRTVDDLCWAVMGAGQFRYTAKGGKRVRTGVKADRWDDLELICRNEVNDGMFMDLADEHAEYVFDRAVHALIHAFGQVLTPEDEECSGWYAPCPLHEVSLADLRIRPGSAEVGGWLDLRCVRGCESLAILAGLRELAEGQKAVAIQGRAA